MQIILDSSFFTSIILLLFLTLCFFTIIYFLVASLERKQVIKEKILKHKIRRNFFYCVIGLLVGSISFILVFVLNILGGAYISTIFIALTLVFALLASPIIFYAGAIPMMLANIAFNVHSWSVQAILFPIIAIIISGFMLFVLEWFKLKKMHHLIYGYLLVSILNILIALFMTSTAMYLANVIDIIVNYFVALILFYIGNYIKNLIASSYSLQQSIIYENIHFIKASFAKNAIDNFIKNNNVETGFVFIFSFLGIDKVPIESGNAASHIIKANILNRLVNLFKGSDVIFFKTTTNKFAAFMKVDRNNINLIEMYKNNQHISRDETDALKLLSEQLKLIPNDIIYNDRNYQILTFADVSIYGVHSCDINYLVSTCERIMEQINVYQGYNNIQVFNPNEDEEVNNRANEIAVLKNYIQPNEVNILIEAVTPITPINKTLYEIRANIFKRLLFTKEQIYDIGNKRNIRVIIMKYISANGLNVYSQLSGTEIKNSKLIIDYPLYEIEREKFSATALYKKIQSYNVDPKQIVINLNFKYNYLLSNNLINNINRLKTMGFSFCISKVNEQTLPSVIKIKPEYVSLSLPKFNGYNTEKNEILNYLAIQIKFLKEQNITTILLH